MVKKYQIIKGDSLEELKKIKKSTFHCCITSPPYWGLRDYGIEGQVGREDSVSTYVESLVNISLEVKRVLRDDGTYWLNIGDTYCGAGHTNKEVPDPKYAAREQEQKAIALNTYNSKTKLEGFKSKELLGIPWEVVKALQKPILSCNECNYKGHWIKWGHIPNHRKWCPICKKIVDYSKYEDGWYLRTDIIWSKNNPIPDPVKDRPTRSHEYIFLLTKNKKYYYDFHAVLESALESNRKSSRIGAKNQIGTQRKDQGRTYAGDIKRNKRTVWTVSVANFPSAHFATFPEKLIEPCILAGTSEKGCCPKCLSPWKKIIKREEQLITVYNSSKNKNSCDIFNNKIDNKKMPQDKEEYRILFKNKGWEPTCNCGEKDVIPSVILDCFSGAATTGYVSIGRGRKYVGIEINQKYIDISEKRLDNPEVAKE